MNELGLSTINTKGTGLNKSDKLTKTSQVFERLNQSMPGGSKGASNNFAALGDRFTKAGNLIYIPQETEIPVLICKKAKRTGGDLIREGTISRKDVFSFIQKKSQKKHYTTPMEFISETKEEFDRTSQGANKKTILPWQAKEIVDKPFRIRFRRHSTVQPDAPSDTAFYFQNREDWKKMMNFLKGIKLLENIPDGQTSLLTLIGKLDKTFKAQMVLKFKQALEQKAMIARVAHFEQKETVMKQSSLLAQFNKNVQLALFSRWKEVASFKDSNKKQLDKETKDRQEKLKETVNASKMLDTLNQKLMLNMQDAWKGQALVRSQPQKEDINILFNILEIANTINNPTVTVNVKLGREITEAVKLNGKVVHNRSRDFKLACEFKEANRRTTKAWRIFGGPGDMSEDQKRFVQDNYVASTANLSGEKFSLHFEDFPLEKLKNVDITIKVLDDKNAEKAYYSTSLKLFQIASKRGKNIWLCLSTNRDLDKQYPLIHFKIESRAIKNRSKQLVPTGAANKAKRFTSDDFVEDTFYSYRFRFPVITPKQKNFLELLPTSWDIIDQKARELESSTKSQTDYIQRIKYKLSKHYHETTTRQLALLKKSAYLWAELQDDIFNYLPDHEVDDKSPLYANEQYLRDVTNTARATTPAGKVYGQAVSSLFKRDVWESKAEWRRFYTELEDLCQRGIPPQYRLDMWSEMSRVVYFVKITEKHLNANQQVTGAAQKALADEDPAVKSENTYLSMFERSHKHISPLYQELEDDIQLLRGSFEVAQLPYEKSIRNICRTFIFWSHQFSDPAKGENTRYYINYSRTIATLCYGLLVCQNCTFIEGNEGGEDHKVFWLLISLCCYIFSSYFQTNEHSVGVDNLTLKKEEISRRRNNLVNSAARCNHMRGIRSDLLLLKFLLRDYEQDIYHKFEELGLPLEYYFGDHMLNLFFNLYNPGLTFRIWDILFFEGSSANQVKCNRMIVCLIFTLLRDCKQQILRAKDAGDIKLIIDIYGKFQTNHGEFIKKSYQVCGEYLEQVVPPNETIMQKLNYINYAFFNKDYNKFDKKIQSVENLIEKNFHNTFIQNEGFYKFAQQKYKYRPEFSPETISYPILSDLIRKFALRFGNPILAEKSRIKQSGIHSARGNKPQSEDGKFKKLLREQIKKVWVKVYRIASRPEDLQQTSLRLGYGKTNLAPLKDYNPHSVGLEGVFDIAPGPQDGAFRDLKIEVWNEKDALYPKKLRTATVDLKALPVNIISRLNLRFDEEDHDIYNEDYVSSEVEVAILLEAPQANTDVHKASSKFVDPLLIPELEDINYKDYKGINIQQAITTEISKQEGISENSLNNYSVIRKSIFSWKENYGMTIDEFMNGLGSIAPYWGPKDLKNVCQLIAQASRNNTFYASDFFVLLILNAKSTTLDQKFALLYDLFSGFESTFAPSQAGDISLDTFKGLVGYLYEVFMIHIPHNQLENIVELATTGSVSCVKQVIINEENSEAKVEYPKRVLNRISNYIHLYHNTKDVHVQSTAILKLLREVYEKEILSTAEGRKSVLPQNTIDIIYMTDGRNHRLTLNVDQSWRPIDTHKNQLKTSPQETARLLGTYQNVLGLNTPPKVFTKEKFIETLQKLPLLNYLFSLENLEQNVTTINLQHIKYTVLLGSDTLYSVNIDQEKPHPTGSGLNQPFHSTSTTSVSTLPSKKKTKFLQYLINWPAFVRKATSHVNSPTKSKSGNQFKVQRTAGTPGNISPAKLDVCLPYAKILQNIKRSLLKEISTELNQSWSNVSNYHPKLYNELLYTLGFDVTVKINKNNVYENINSEGSPFLSLLDAAENLLTTDQTLSDLEIVFSLKTSTIPDPYVEPYNQLSLYRYTDGSSEWLNCKIRYKYSYGNIDAASKNQQVDGYGVIFERYPLESVLRKTSEVIIRDQVDLNELELKKVDKRTMRATTIDQVPGMMHKSNTFNESKGLDH